MQSLFPQEFKSEYLGVIYNDKSFNPDEFDNILIYIFVSSPKYFFKQTAHFKDIELFLGV
jgi:hypothetical protein